MQTEQLVQVAIDALEDLKAQDIVTLDVRDKTSVTDYMVIACGSSSRQVKSLADNVLTKAKENGVKPLGSEGLESGEWALLDLGDVVVRDAPGDPPVLRPGAPVAGRRAEPRPAPAGRVTPACGCA